MPKISSLAWTSGAQVSNHTGLADGRSSPPFGEFSDDLAAIINGYWAVLERGVQVDGTEIRPLNESEIRQHCHQSRQLGLRTVVVVATARIVREEIAGREVVLLHRISSIGIP
ncbi:hypothetical protein KL925_004932 [Ogataea polymorpha]|nr:hypothetical protein KL908_004859 [Ogataea polymorpha]KAG7924759.1 hypothetical protein KL925_004932 [Ogataea polymorpha]